jgi:hypothetical protein
VASDMQDDLRKMIERLINQKRGPIRKGPIKRKPRQIGIDVGPFPDPPKRPRPRPRPMPKPRSPKGDGPKPRPMPRVPRGDGPKPRPMPKAPGLPRKPRKRKYSV